MTDSSSRRDVGSLHRYCVYGVGIVSDCPLTMPHYSHPAVCHVECLRAHASVFQDATRGAVFEARADSWYHHAALNDGSTYVRWDSIGEFLVAADGRRIHCRPVNGPSNESFQVYMLGQALSFALLKQQFEPLHATVVVVNDHAVAFLGGHAFGKSTLAAGFLEAGHRLLTDDLLILQQTSGESLAYPGPPRLKLFPGIARRFLGTADGAAMNAGTGKLILPIDGPRCCARPVPLRAIYSLAAPREACRQQHVSIETLSPREAFVELVGGTFNRRLVSPERLKRQFTIMGCLAGRLSVKKLAYPRALDRVQEVLEAVLDDLVRDARIAPPAPRVATVALH